MPRSAGPFDEMGGVRGRQHDASGRRSRDRLHQPLGVAGADRDVAEPEPVERGQRRARDERPRVVGGHDPLAGLDAGRGVAARRACDPVVEVGGGQRDVARRAGGAAGRVDAHDLVAGRAQVRAERVLGRDRGPDLGLLGQRQLGDLVEPDRRGRPRASRGRTASARAGTRAALSNAAASLIARTRSLPRPRRPCGSRSARAAPRRDGRAARRCGRGSAPPSRSPPGTRGRA